MEGGKWSGAYNGALAAIGKQELIKQMAVAGIFYHLYNQVSPATVITLLSVYYTYTCVGLFVWICLPCITCVGFRAHIKPQKAWCQPQLSWKFTVQTLQLVHDTRASSVRAGLTTCVCVTAVLLHGPEPGSVSCDLQCG